MADGHRAPWLLTVAELRAEVDAGRVDALLLAMTDMQGRLQGKRLPRRLGEHAQDHTDGGPANCRTDTARGRRRHEAGDPPTGLCLGASAQDRTKAITTIVYLSITIQRVA
jgi:hypothetical protein